MRPSLSEFTEMMRHLETYRGTGIGAEQDFLTDFWKNKGGIVGLPRKYNCQMHQVALLGPQAPEDSLYWQMVTNHSEEVANWHFSADPKPVDGGVSHFQLWRLPATAKDRRRQTPT